ncbi:hypothetical protein EUX98_g8860 [Antrodiella citrinella]|uniref:Uncharacterized protein n=1 Tax=Antrodiella citrinella TaxID=2447956 RepID=A0A4S4M803_9APHY|nr:hypothetical protein EUX98_g8860 [Antrodiella citrinella]
MWVVGKVPERKFIVKIEDAREVDMFYYRIQKPHWEARNELMKRDPNFYKDMQITKPYKGPKAGRMTPGRPKLIRERYEADLAAGATGSTVTVDDYVSPEYFDDQSSQEATNTSQSKGSSKTGAKVVEMDPRVISESDFVSPENYNDVIFNVIENSSQEATSKSEGKGKGKVVPKIAETKTAAVITCPDFVTPSNFDKEVDRAVKTTSQANKARRTGKNIAPALIKEGTIDRPYVVDDDNDNNDDVIVLPESGQCTTKASSRKKRAIEEDVGGISAKVLLSHIIYVALLNMFYSEIQGILLYDVRG